MAYRECQEIGWNGLRHSEREGPTAGPWPLTTRGCRHHRGERLRHRDLGIVRHPGAWGVLQRCEGAGVNCLTLAEEERMVLAGGLGRVEPLQRQGLRRRAVGNHYLAGLGRKLQLELLAKDG